MTNLKYTYNGLTESEIKDIEESKKNFKNDYTNYFNSIKKIQEKAEKENTCVWSALIKAGYIKSSPVINVVDDCLLVDKK